MPIQPPSDALFAQPAMEPMELFGRMRALTIDRSFSGTLPVIWQCSDESQGIKRALFGYTFDCPSFNLGRVGALLDPTRLATAAHHGHDLVIFGGSHLGAHEKGGLGYIERVHGQVSPCCGLLCRVLQEYLEVYQRAALFIRLLRAPDGLCIEIPYKYLFRKPAGTTARIQINLSRLVAGEPLYDSNLGKVYQLHPALVEAHAADLASVTVEPSAIGPLLGPGLFTFNKALNPESLDPRTMLEVGIFDFWSDIVTSPNPHRRLANVNTWRQFHRLAAYLTDAFSGKNRNVLVVAGLTLDHSIRRNTVIPQFGWLMERESSQQGSYLDPPTVSALLAAQSIFRPPKSYLEYAGAS